MNEREIDILHSIVESYIQTGEPVASRTVARHRKDNLSPATVRNVMADLCDGGYLAQPHTSAGRVPTEKAFRSYVQSLAKSRLLVAELQRLRGELSQMATMEARVTRCPHILRERTQSGATPPPFPPSSQPLPQTELVPWPDQRVLMIV